MASATLCRRWRLNHSLAPVGRPQGNAVAQRTIHTLKEEVLWLAEVDSLTDLQAAIDAWCVHCN